MRFELLPLVSICLSPLLFILLFNEFLLFTELDLERLVAEKRMFVRMFLQTLKIFRMKIVIKGDKIRFCCSVNSCYSLSSIWTGGRGREGGFVKRDRETQADCYGSFNRMRGVAEG